MNCIEVFKVSNHLYEFSPCGTYLATCVHQRLTIRDTESWQSVQDYNCVDSIQAIHWSPDSKFLLCAMYKIGITQVWSLDDPSWSCKIDEGSCGMVNSMWSPDSRHVLTTAEFHLRVTVWSLVDKSVAYIRNTKAAKPGLCFSSSGRYLAVAERRDCKDYVSILDCSVWQLLKSVETSTRDLAGVNWSPNEDVLCVWDSNLDYNVSLYTMGGHLASYSAYQQALGVRVVSWAPSGQFLAVGSYDQKVRLLNNLTWHPIAEFAHAAKIESDVFPDAVLYIEAEASETESIREDFEVVAKRPFNVPCSKLDWDKANPKMGICAAKFSQDGRHLATLNENMPCTMWIWSIRSVNLAAIIQCKSAVTGFEWNPVNSRLSVCTGREVIYVWSTESCHRFSSPELAEVSATKARWSKNGEMLAASGKDSVCICWIAPDDD